MNTLEIPAKWSLRLKIIIGKTFCDEATAPVFVETGLIGNWRQGNLSDWRNGVSGEVRFDFTIARYVPFGVTIGAALGLVNKVSYQVYSQVTGELLTSILAHKMSLR